MLASRERRETSVALTSTLHWFETDVLAEERNYKGLGRLNTALLEHAAMRSPTRRVILDIDSSESPMHGTQERSAYNGHFESVCYHPLFVFSPEGDCLAAKLRPGNVHSADGWDDVLLPIIDRYRAQGQTVVVRADAALPCPPSTRPWNAEGCGTRSACRPTTSWSGPSKICSSDPAADPATPRWSATAASTIRRPPGTDPDA